MPSCSSGTRMHNAGRHYPGCCHSRSTVQDEMQFRHRTCSILGPSEHKALYVALQLESMTNTWLLPHTNVHKNRMSIQPNRMRSLSTVLLSFVNDLERATTMKARLNYINYGVGLSPLVVAHTFLYATRNPSLSVHGKT